MYIKNNKNRNENNKQHIHTVHNRRQGLHPDDDANTGAQARGYLKQDLWFRFLYFILFEKTHILSKLFQKPILDILQAVELSEVTVMGLENFRDKSFNDSRTKCAENNRDVIAQWKKMLDSVP